MQRERSTIVNSRNKKRILIALSIVLLGWIASQALEYAPDLLVDRTVKTVKGTLSYHLFVRNGFIEEVPVIEPSGVILYQYSTKRLWRKVGLEYTSRIGTNEMRAQLSHHFRANGFTTELTDETLSAWSPIIWEGQRDGSLLFVVVQTSSNKLTEVMLFHSRAN